ncbi:MAG: hypothetical protein V1866_05760 [archaeon]
MVEIRITYETLFDLLRREKNREDLQKLDDDFYDQVYSYLLEKQQTLNKKGDELFASVEKEKLKIQFQNIRRLIKELYERREKKIINMAVVKARTGSDIIDTSALLPSERRFFDEQVTLFANYKEECLDRILHLKEPRNGMNHDKSGEAVEAVAPIVMEERDEREDDQPALPKKDSAPGHFVSASVLAKDSRADGDDHSRKKIKIVTALPKFVGKNGEILGPFEKDDIVELDGQIAEVLLKKGRAEAAE